MIRIEIPGAPPLLLNSRLHHMAKYRGSRKWYNWVRIALAGSIPKTPYNRARIRYERHHGFVEPDQDNLVSGFKWIQDGIVMAGVVSNDTQSIIMTEHHWFPSSPKKSHVVIEIEDLTHQT